MSGKRSRTKGHSFERWVANQLKGVYPDAKRHLEVQMQEAKGYDLDNTGVFRIQCKAYKKYAPISCIEEVHPEKGTIPMLVTKGDRKPVMACLPFDYLVMLLSHYKHVTSLLEAQGAKEEATI